MILILLDSLLLALTLRLSLKLIRPEPSTLCGRGPCVSKCREPTTPKRDVKGSRTVLLVTATQTNFNSLQRRNTRFPANFIADRAEEDDGGEAFQHSSGCLKAAPAPAALGSCTTAAYRKASQYYEDNPRPPRYTPLNRSRLPRGWRQKRQHK